MKIVSLGTLLLCLPVIVFADPSLEKNAADKSANVQLDATVIIGTRSEAAINQLPAGMTVIDREEIRKSGARHIVDVLQARGGIQVTDNFGDGSRSLISLRGFGENAHSNTLILIDGRPLNNPDIGAPELNAISLKDVERIEILQGSAGVLYGDQAVGGVINIVTRGPLKAGKQQRGFVSLQGGSYQGRRAQAAYSYRLQNGLGFRISGEQRHSDNFRDHNDLRYQNLLGRLDWDLGAGRLFLEYQTISEDLDVPGAVFEGQVDANRAEADPSFLNDFVDTDTQVFRLGGDIEFGEQWQFISELTHRKSRARFRLSFFGAPENQDAFQHRDVYSLNPRFVGRLPLAHGDALVTVGMDVTEADYELTSRFGTQTNDQHTRAGYFQAIVPVSQRWTVTGGYRLARVENDLQDNSPFPAFDVYPQGRRFHETETATEFGIEYQPTTAIRAFARIDRNFRFAKLDEFFSSGAAPGTGQVILESQTGESFEIGGGWYGPSGQFQVTVYELDLDDEIVFDPVTFTNINLDATQRTGVIFDTAWEALPWLGLDAGLNIVQAEVERGPFADSDIPLVAERTAHAGIDFLPIPDWSIRLEGRHVGERGFSGDFNETLGKLDAFTLVNLATQFRWQGFGINARVNNLLDKEYSEFGAKRTLFLPPTFAPQDFETFFPSPGRNYWLELSYEFGDAV